MNRTIRIIVALLVALACWGPALAQTHFTEVAERTGVAESVAWNTYVSWADFDGDGYQDLYVTNFGQYIKGFVTPEGVAVADSLVVIPNHLYRNNRDGTFTDLAARAGLSDKEILEGPASWGDFDNDGDLDLYVGNYDWTAKDFSFTSRLYQNNGDGTFTEVAARAGVTNQGGSGVGGVWGDYNRDGWLDLYACNATVIDAEGKIDLSKSVLSHLYQNNGDGTFADVTAHAGVGDFGGYVVSGDYDSDGLLDLYLVNNALQIPNPSRLYRNNGDGTFTDMADRAGIVEGSEVQALTGAFGDYDNDGLLDLYRVNNNAANNLFHNNGDGTFTEVTTIAGVADDKIGFGNGGAWADYDNDGFLDLYVTNLTSSSPCRLFHNQGDGTFVDVGIEAGVNTPDGTGAGWADYDHDGFLDLFVTVVHIVDGSVVSAPNLLFHNEGNANHWLVLQLKGTVSNRDAIGAKVTAVSGKHRQRRDVESVGSGWGSQPSLPVEFGFGSAAVVDSLIIRWPSGIVQVMTQVPTDQYLVLAESRETEPTAVLEEHTVALPAALSLSQNYPNPFNSQTVIRFALPASGEVELGVYDLAGQRVALLVAGMREAGTYAVNWDGLDERGEELASGTYLYRLWAGGREETRKLALLRLSPQVITCTG